VIAFALTATTADPTDFDALSKAVAKCDRAVVTKTVTDTIARHSTFLIDAYAEQRAIAGARGDLAERRRKLHSGEKVPGEKTSDTEAALNLAREGHARPARTGHDVLLSPAISDAMRGSRGGKVTC